MLCGCAATTHAPQSIPHQSEYTPDRKITDRAGDIRLLLTKNHDEQNCPLYRFLFRICLPAKRIFSALKIGHE